MQKKPKPTRPFITVNLRLSNEEYSALNDKKEGDTWEEFVLRMAGIENGRRN